MGKHELLGDQSDRDSVSSLDEMLSKPEKRRMATRGASFASSNPTTRKASATLPTESSFRTDEIPVRFYVEPGVSSSLTYCTWDEAFPLILTGIIDKEEYCHVVRTINTIICSVNNEKKYGQGVTLTLAVTGSLLFFPLIPLLVLDKKRQKKIAKSIRAFLSTVNHDLEVRGMRWNMLPPMYSKNSEAFGSRPCLEIINVTLIAPERRAFFVSNRDRSSKSF